MPGREQKPTAKNVTRRPSSTRELLRLREPSRRQLSRHQREVRTRRSILIGGATLLMLIVGVLGFGYWRENIARAQETVADVFGERITADDLLARARPQLSSVDRRIALFQANGMTQQAAQLQLQRQRLPETVLNDMVEDRVIRREAAGRGIELSPVDLEAKIRSTIAESDAASQPQHTPTPAPTSPADATPTATPAGTPTPRPTPTPAPTLTEDGFGPALAGYLNQTGLSEAQLRGSTESELYEQALRQIIGEEVPAVQEQVQARHAAFKAEESARAALQQLLAGVSFEEIAASQSEDRATKDQGGDLGWLPRLGRDPALDEALFSLQPNQLSDVVKTNSGYEIIQVLARDPARLVEEGQLEQMRRRHFGDWLAAAIGNPEIDRQLSPEESAWVIQRASKRG